jgi:hypothetical protein
MKPAELTPVAAEAQRLQSAYALAVDTRNWSYFAEQFTPDVLAHYPNLTYHGMDEWLAEFIPFHDGCEWTFHLTANHVAGEDENGIWATCYGLVKWTMKDKPGRMSIAHVLFRDRLSNDGERWRIYQRHLDVLMGQHDIALPEGAELPNTILGLADWS